MVDSNVNHWSEMFVRNLKETNVGVAHALFDSLKITLKTVRAFINFFIISSIATPKDTNQWLENSIVSSWTPLTPLSNQMSIPDIFTWESLPSCF